MREAERDHDAGRHPAGQPSSRDLALGQAHPDDEIVAHGLAHGLEHLGFEVTNDVDMGFMRWLTVALPSDPQPLDNIGWVLAAGVIGFLGNEPEAEFAEIERLAGELDVPVSALIRSWVLAGLADERGTSLRSAIERIVGDADRLRRLVANSDIA